VNVFVGLALVLVGVVGSLVVVIQDPLRQALTVSLFGILLGIVFFAVQAPDVALSEIVVGAVALPLMILLALAKLRGGCDDAAHAPPALSGLGPGPGDRRRRRPGRPAPVRPQHGPVRAGAERGVGARASHHRRGHCGELRLSRRRHDGRGVHLLRRGRRRRAAPRHPSPTSHRVTSRTRRPVGGCRRRATRSGSWVSRWWVPTVLFAIYVIAHGHLTPGGGFQGGVVLATAVLLVYLAGEYQHLHGLYPDRAIEGLEAGGAAAYVALGIAGLALSGSFLATGLRWASSGTSTRRASSRSSTSWSARRSPPGSSCCSAPSCTRP